MNSIDIHQALIDLQAYYAPDVIQLHVIVHDVFTFEGADEELAGNQFSANLVVGVLDRVGHSPRCSSYDEAVASAVSNARTLLLKQLEVDSIRHAASAAAMARIIGQLPSCVNDLT